MIAFIGVAATLGVFVCLVLAVVSRLHGGNAKIPLLWAAVCVALVALMASFETDKPTETTEPPPDAPEAVEVQEPADSAEPAQNDTETPPEPVAEPEPQDNAITLVAGEKGLYGEWFTMNEEAFYIYRVPAGVYRVTNAGKYPTQATVYEGVIRNGETGFDEYSASGDVAWMDVGGSKEITVPEGWFIEIHEPTKITLVRTGDAPGTVREPEADKIPQSPESVIEAMNAEYSNLPGIHRYNASYEEGAFVIRFNAPGVGETAEKMASGEGYISDDAIGAYEAWEALATRLSEEVHNLVNESGRDEDAKVFIMHELKPDDVILCAINGTVCYNLGRGITW